MDVVNFICVDIFLWIILLLLLYSWLWLRARLSAHKSRISKQLSEWDRLWVLGLHSLWQGVKNLLQWLSSWVRSKLQVNELWSKQVSKLPRNASVLHILIFCRNMTSDTWLGWGGRWEGRWGGGCGWWELESKEDVLHPDRRLLE